MKKKNINELNKCFENKSSFSIINQSVNSLFKNRIVYVCSFGSESAILLHMLSLIDKNFPIIFLNTKKLFRETIIYKNKLIKSLSLKNVEEYEPDLEEIKLYDRSDLLWKKNPDLCCQLRKVNPLVKGLKKYDAWISGRKSYQNSQRATKKIIDYQDGKFIVSPLIKWNQKKINTYFEKYKLSRHPLFSDGYISIGCKNCTIKTLDSKDSRSGRWAGTQKTECGIHLSKIGIQKL